MFQNPCLSSPERQTTRKPKTRKNEKKSQKNEKQTRKKTLNKYFSELVPSTWKKDNSQNSLI